MKGGMKNRKTKKRTSFVDEANVKLDEDQGRTSRVSGEKRVSVTTAVREVQKNKSKKNQKTGDLAKAKKKKKSHQLSFYYQDLAEQNTFILFC